MVKFNTDRLMIADEVLGIMADSNVDVIMYLKDKSGNRYDELLLSGVGKTMVEELWGIFRQVIRENKPIERSCYELQMQKIK